MKKILFFIIVQIVIGTAAVAQQQEVYTLDLQGGGFLFKQDGKVRITPEKDSSLFIVKADTLYIDTILVSKTDQGSKKFVIRDSIILLQANVKKSIHVGEPGFEKQLQLTAGKYEFTWGNGSWKVELKPIEKQPEVEPEIVPEQIDQIEENEVVLDENEPEKESKGPWKVAFFALLAASLVGLIILQWKNILKLFRKQEKQPLFDVLGERYRLNLKSFAQRNPEKVEFDGTLSLKLKKDIKVLPIRIEEIVKGNQLIIMLAEPAKIRTSISYVDFAAPYILDEREGQNTLIYDIDNERSIKEISITFVGHNTPIHINALIVATIQKPQEMPPQVPLTEDKKNEEEHLDEKKEDSLMTRTFQQSLLDIFNALDEYKTLDDDARLAQLKKDLSAAREQKASLQEAQDEADRAQQVVDEKAKLQKEMLSWIDQNKYIRSFYQKRKEKEGDFWAALKAIFTQDIVEPKVSVKQELPLSERLKKKNTDDVAAAKAFILSTYIAPILAPLQIKQLKTTTWGSFKDSLVDYLSGIRDKEMSDDEQKDMVKELVLAVNEKLPEDKRLNEDEVEKQLVERLALPTNFDEAEQMAWNKVAESLGVKMVNADTLNDEIGNKVQTELNQVLSEKLTEKTIEVEQQSVEELKEGLSDFIDNVQECKTMANVLQKVKGQISGARDRENNAIANIRNAYHEQTGKDLPKNIALKDAIKQYKIDVPKSVQEQEWEKVGDTINSLGYGETGNVSEATLPSALGTYYEGRLQKEVTSRLNDFLKSDRKDIEAVIKELNKSLDVTNEAETLCKEYETNTVTGLKDKLVAETNAIEEEKKKVEQQKKDVEAVSQNRADVINNTVDILRMQLNTSVKELGKLIGKAGYLKPCTANDEEGEEVADRNQDAMIEHYDNLKEALLAAIPNDGEAITPAEAKAKVQTALENDLVKAFENKDLSQFSVIDKIARYYAYSRLPFMTENAQEANGAKSLRKYGVVFNRSRMTAIYAQMCQLLADFGIQLIVPTLFAERLGEGQYSQSTNDGDLSILCPHPEYWKQTIANADKKDIIIDVAATGYFKDGNLVKETEVIINNN